MPRRDHKTAEDIARIEAIKAIGCIACIMERIPYRRMCEWHHMTKAGFTQGHQDTIGLCQWHHKGVCEDGMTSSMMRAKYGPSLAKGSKPFYANYGDYDFLLGYQDHLIEKLKNGQEIYPS